MLMLRQFFFFIVLLCGAGGVLADQQPIDVLREHIEAGIAVLKDADPASATERSVQQDQLCAIAHEMFDTYAFSRLVLAGDWQHFAPSEQHEFVEVFGEFLCRYYLSRLQERYSDEQVIFGEQIFKSEQRATVSARVIWNDIPVPVMVRMARREGRWKAYDIVVAGISAVLLYRAQFQSALLHSTPENLIEELRRRIAEQG